MGPARVELLPALRSEATFEIGGQLTEHVNSFSRSRPRFSFSFSMSIPFSHSVNQNLRLKRRLGTGWGGEMVFVLMASLGGRAR
jgi:hypothetical protein